MSDSEYPSWPAEYAPRAARRPWSPWQVLGTALAVITLLAGLALLAYMIVVAVAFSIYADNK
jgi:hypothetical protein